MSGRDEENPGPSKPRKNGRKPASRTLSSLLTAEGTVRTRSMAQQVKRVEQLQESQQENPCSICLVEPEEEKVAFTNDCFHRYCFDCIMEWAKVKNTCPLCTKVFTAVVRSTPEPDGSSKYEEVPVPDRVPQATDAEAIFEELLGIYYAEGRRPAGVINVMPRNARLSTDDMAAAATQNREQNEAGPSRPRTMNHRLGNMAPSFRSLMASYSAQGDGVEIRFRRPEPDQAQSPVLPSSARIYVPRLGTREEARSSFLETVRMRPRPPQPIRGETPQMRAVANAFRESVYERHIRVHPDPSGRARESSPRFYKENPAVKHRLSVWLNREVSVLLSMPISGHASSTRDVVSFVLMLIEHHDIRSPEFRSRLATSMYLPPSYLDHFLHEFNSFAVSTIETVQEYDRSITYDDPNGARVGETAPRGSTATTETPVRLDPTQTTPPRPATDATPARSGSPDGFLTVIRDLPGFRMRSRPPTPHPSHAVLDAKSSAYAVSPSYEQGSSPVTLSDEPWEPEDAPGPSHRPDRPRRANQSSGQDQDWDWFLDAVLETIRDDSGAEAGSPGFEVTTPESDREGEVEILEELPPKHLRTPEIIDLASDVERNTPSPPLAPPSPNFFPTRRDKEIVRGPNVVSQKKKSSQTTPDGEASGSAGQERPFSPAPLDLTSPETASREPKSPDCTPESGLVREEEVQIINEVVGAATTVAVEVLRDMLLESRRRKHKRKHRHRSRHDSTHSPSRKHKRSHKSREERRRRKSRDERQRDTTHRGAASPAAGTSASSGGQGVGEGASHDQDDQAYNSMRAAMISSVLSTEDSDPESHLWGEGGPPPPLPGSPTILIPLNRVIDNESENAESEPIRFPTPPNFDDSNGSGDASLSPGPANARLKSVVIVPRRQSTD